MTIREVHLCSPRMPLLSGRILKKPPRPQLHPQLPSQCHKVSAHGALTALATDSTQHQAPLSTRVPPPPPTKGEQLYQTRCRT